jgi:uncharacterized protein YciI
VRRERGGPWDWSKPLREQDGWDEHADFMEQLVTDGFVVLGGPIEDVDHGRDVVHIVDAPSEEAVRERLAQDNWERNGMLRTTTVERWIVLLDGR